MNKKKIIFNWKMEPAEENNALELLSFVHQLFSDGKNDIYIAPPHIYLDSFRRFIKEHSSTILLCAQDCSFEDGGAFTGETSARMLRNLSVNAVLIGHSERRLKLGETEEEVSGKTLSALAHGLLPVLFIGESYEVWKLGESEVKSFLRQEVNNTLLPANDTFKNTKVVVAYEPIWAISTNQNYRSGDPIYIERMGSFIKEELNKTFALLRIELIYGGSVNKETLASYLNSHVYGGFVIGAASHDKNFLRQLATLI